MTTDIAKGGSYCLKCALHNGTILKYLLENHFIFLRYCDDYKLKPGTKKFAIKIKVQ